MINEFLKGAVEVLFIALEGSHTGNGQAVICKQKTGKWRFTDSAPVMENLLV